jgi:hypothetical protein
LFQDEARQGEIIWTVREGEQTLDMVFEPPLPKRKKFFSKTSRSVHGKEKERQNLIKQATSILSRPDDEYDDLRKTYAAKLRRMPAAQRDIADNLINDILFKGL